MKLNEISGAPRPKPPASDQGRQMLATCRRALNWFAKNFGTRYAFAAVSKGEIVLVVAKGERGKKLRALAESWGHVDDLELWG